MTEEMDVIADRTLELLDDAGQIAGSVTIRIGRPAQEATGEWGCTYEIKAPDGGHSFRVYGIDGIQAIQCAFTVVGGYLAGTDAARTGRLRLNGETDLGFPVPPAEQT